MDQQRHFIEAMENALFVQRSTTSASEEAKLARIPQVIWFILHNYFLLYYFLLLFIDGKGELQTTIQYTHPFN